LCQVLAGVCLREESEDSEEKRKEIVGWGGGVRMSEIKKKEARTIRVGVQVRKT
jgi:hypothetical protein